MARGQRFWPKVKDFGACPQGVLRQQLLNGAIGIHARWQASGAEGCHPAAIAVINNTAGGQPIKVATVPKGTGRSAVPMFKPDRELRGASRRWPECEWVKWYPMG